MLFILFPTFSYFVHGCFNTSPPLFLRFTDSFTPSFLLLSRPASFKFIVREPSIRLDGLFHKPVLHVDEIGLTSDKYLPLNDTVGSLPLKLTFSPMAPGRLRLMSHFAQSLESQKELGFSDSDIDDVRRLVRVASQRKVSATMGVSQSAS
jgi:hypothetical protein